MKNHFIATTGFGIEAVVKRELEKLNMTDIEAQNGKVNFYGSFKDMARANVWLRSADRVLWCVKEGKVTNFDELFDAVSSVSWAEFLPQDAKIHVTGRSVLSKLSSVPACQSVTKKAIIKSMQAKYKLQQFPENGPLYTVQVALLKDWLTLTIDTSGEGLFQRGYREKSLEAPIKETLAAAMILLSYWDKHRIFLDPLCGSGTLPIEAALIAKNIAPGIHRNFVSETWPHIPKNVYKEVRKDAYTQIDVDFTPEIYASDISEEAIAQTMENIEKAGVDDAIKVKKIAVKDVVLPGEYGVMITNPPYGERMGTKDSVEQLYWELGKKFAFEDTWSSYIITAFKDFEHAFGKKANAKRKLYNGRIETDFYQYYGKRPPKDFYPETWFQK